MTSDTQGDTTFYWTISLQNQPILQLFGDVCKAFGFPESDDTISGVRHKIWEDKGMFLLYPSNRKQKENADVIIVCTREKTRDIILEILSRMAEKKEENIMMHRSARLILRVLREKARGLTTTEIQTEVLLASKTVNHALRDLVSAGLVIKRADLSDMRRPKFYHVAVYDHLMVLQKIQGGE